MRRFYTHCFVDRGRVKVRGWSVGRRFQDVVQYKPYLFVRSSKPDSDTPYRTLKDQKVERMDFDSIWDAKEFVDQYSDVSNYEVYGSTNWAYNYIYDTFKDVQYDAGQISVVNVDIEVGAD